VPTFRHFDWLAPYYDQLISQPQEIPLRHSAELPVVGPLLDAGGGTGRVARSLAGLADPIIVLDASLAMLRQARRKEGLEAVGGASERLPFPSGAFPRIILVDAYHHLQDQSASLAEVWRVLADGGRLVIEEPDVADWRVKFIALAEKLLLMRSHFETPQVIAQRLASLGAQVDIQRQDSTAWIIARKSQPS
jgi:ubiquinone/menaquinone biosynthesis C-methylase UbiE